MALDPAELETFLRKALDVQLSDPDEDLTEAEVKVIAKRAGLSDEDWERLRETLEAHLDKGRNFLKFENPADAVAELNQAVALAPYRVDVLYDCGHAHLLWSKEGGPPESVLRACELFEKCLRIEPGHASAAEGLSRLTRRSKRKTTQKKKRRRITGLSTVGLAVLLGGGFWIWKGRQDDAPNMSSLPPAIAETDLNSREALPFGDKLYKVFRQNLTWQEARDFCERMGGQLAVIPDAETQAFIETLSKDQRLWLGATDENSEGDWKWIDGSPMTYTHWEYNRPDNNGRLGEHFLMTMPGGKWEDTKPVRPGVPGLLPVDGFLCEWPRPSEKP